MESFGAIGERLRAERKRLDLTQEELSSVAAAAGAVGSTRQSQALYEKGQRFPDVAYMAAVAGVGVDVRYVVTGRRDYTPAPALTTDEQRVVALYRLADAALRKAALRVLVEGEMPAAQPKVLRHGDATVTIHPDAKVGGVLYGNQVVHGPQTFHVSEPAPPTAPARKSRRGKNG